MGEASPGGGGGRVAPGRVVSRVSFIVTNLWREENVVRFYNQRGTAEQWIKEGKYALNWTRLSCHGFEENRFACNYLPWAGKLPAAAVAQSGEALVADDVTREAD